jgi:hypothetical protein
LRPARDPRTRPNYDDQTAAALKAVRDVPQDGLVESERMLRAGLTPVVGVDRRAGMDMVRWF